ncbi:hypothetical protein [Chitinophaga sp.]|uniref:hypothetical protein n=1 Tax=Chitinophaga sp. TaxID=1869181 RepID=UPI0031D1ADCD
MQQGNCRLCTKFGQLTYEHVPPKVTFNKNTRYKSVPFLDYMKMPNPLESKFKGKVEQGGVGYYSLCGTCNSFLGSNYVRYYQEYSNTFIQFAKKKEFNMFEFAIHNFNALNVLKQIVSMFFSINDDTFSKNNRELAEFVLDPKSNKFPSQFRVFNYLNTEGQLRNVPVMALGNLSSKGVVVGTELAFPPLGHILTIDFDGQLPCHQEITSFKDYKFDETTSFDFKVYRLPTYLPILLDYRHKETIKKSIDGSL